MAVPMVGRIKRRARRGAGLNRKARSLAGRVGVREATPQERERYGIRRPLGAGLGSERGTLG